MDDELDDRDLSRALGREADRLTGPIDTDAALGAVHRRIRGRRRWRAATATAMAAAAAAVTVVAVASFGGEERGTVRTPATQVEAAPGTTAEATTTAAVVVVTTPAPAPSTTPATAPPRTVPATAAPVVPTTTAATAPAPPPTERPAPPPSTSRFSSTGGSIDVRLLGGAIALVGDPSPSSGWSYRVDDNGPDRVRVRFERDDERSEIRVDLENGRLVPEIIEG